MDVPNADFYLNQSEALKACLLAMRSLLLKADGAISETTKYGMPCFLYKSHICCYLWVDKKRQMPYFLWAQGAKLQHPTLEKGKRARMKTLTVDPEKDLPVRVIHTILKQALTQYN